MELSLRKLRKSIAAFSVVALIATFFVVANVANAAAVDVYGDVEGGEWYEADVDWALDHGLLDPDQAFFRAGDNSTRAEFTKVTAVAIGLAEAECDETIFPDVDASHWACGWVTAGANAALVSGMGEGHEFEGYFLPNDNILRAEAAKVLVEGFELTGIAVATLASDVFPDADPAYWWDSYMGIAHDNNVFCGYPDGTIGGANPIVRAEMVAVEGRASRLDHVCGVTPVGPGAIHAFLDSSTAPESHIPRNANGVSFATWGFTNTGDVPVILDGLTLSRIGLGFPEDFDKVRLYIDNVDQGSAKNINSTTNEAEFTSLDMLLPVDATLLIESRAGMDAAENSENALCLADSEDVIGYVEATGDPVDVSGDFPLCGNYMYTTSAEVGLVTYSTTGATGTINIGDQKVKMTTLKLEVDGEDGILQQIALKNTGSSDPEDFANMTVEYQNNPFDGVELWWQDDYLITDWSATPLVDKTIPDGGVWNLVWYMDATGGLGSTVALDVHKDTHIYLTGGSLGYGLNVEENPDTPPVVRDIEGGRLAFAPSANNPTIGDVAPNADNHAFLAFNVSTAGDEIILEEFVVCFEANPLNPGWPDVSDFTDTRVQRWNENTSMWDNVASGVDPANGFDNGTCWEIDIEDTINLPSSSTDEFRFTFDAESSAVNGDQFRVNFDTTSVVAEYGNGDPVQAADISGGLVSGNWQTVAPPSMTIEVSSAPGAKTYVDNMADPPIDLVGLDLTASTASDLIVRQIQFDCLEVGAWAGYTCDDAFTDLDLYWKDGAVWDPVDSCNLSGGVVECNSVDLDVLSGQTEKVMLKGKTTSSPTAGDQVAFEIQNEATVVVDDEWNFTLTNAQLDTCMGGTADQCLQGDGESPLHTFLDNGALEVSIEDTLSDDVVLDGTTDILAAQITLTETSNAEDLKIRKLRLVNDIDGAGCLLSGVDGVKIANPAGGYYSNPLKIDPGPDSNPGGITEFTFDADGAGRVIVPRDGQNVLDVLVDTNLIGSGALSGDCFNFQLLDLDGEDYTIGSDIGGAGMDIDAVGLSSGNLLCGWTGGPICTVTDYVTGTTGYAADLYTAGANYYEIYDVLPSINTIYEMDGSALYGFGQSPNATDPVLGFNASIDGDATATLTNIVISDNPSGACGSVVGGQLRIYTVNEWLYGNPNNFLADDVGGAAGTFDAATDFGNPVGSSDGIKVTVGDPSVDYVVVGDTSACIFDNTPLDTNEVWISDFEWDDSNATAPPYWLDDFLQNNTGTSDTLMIFG